VLPGREEIAIALENFAEEDVTLNRNVLLHDLLFAIKFFFYDRMLKLEISNVF
jgi:hypothetical protein